MLNSIRYRSSYLLLLFLSVFISFGLLLGPTSVKAASDNLISSSISNWDIASDTGEIRKTGSYSSYYFFVPEGSSLCTFFDASNLISGHSYSFSFKIPGQGDYGGIDVIKHYKDGGELYFYLAFRDSSGNFIENNNIELFRITESNVGSVVGTTVSTNFVCPTFKGTPCIMAYACSNPPVSGGVVGTSEARRFYVDDVVLIDNDDNSKELTGIKGFLHNIWWDLVGGPCEEEDCPHYFPDNPHQSLADRITDAFSKDILTEDGTLSGWFTRTVDDITAFFKDDDGKSFKDWFNDLGDGFTKNFDLQLDWFDSFKPRVYLEFDWVTGFYINSSGELVQRDDRTSYSCTSDIFKVPEGCSFKVDFAANDSSIPEYGFGYICKYDAAENYIGREQSRIFSSVSLEPGFKYRFMFIFNQVDMTQIPDLSGYSNNIFKVYCDEGWVNASIFKLGLSAKRLVVPSDAFMIKWKNDCSSVMTDNLGFISSSWSLVNDLFTGLKSLLGSYTPADEEGVGLVIALPEFSFDFLGYHIPIWPGGDDAITLSFDFINSINGLSILFRLYQACLHFLFSISLCSYALKIYKELFSS